MSKQLKYTFNYIENCNMCGSPVASHKIMGKRLNKSQGRKPGKKIGITTTIMQCNKCHLIYSNPQPIPSSIQDHYGIPAESYWKEHYFKLDESYFKIEIERVKKLIGIAPGSKSLDIGAGIGKGMIALKNAGFDSYGIEPSEAFLKKAIEKMGITADKLQLASVENAEFPAEFFDFITFSAVLEHLYDASASIKKALAWLKPGGIIHIEVPSSNWLSHKFINLYYRLTGSDYVGNLSPMHKPFHLYEFSPESFKANAEINNYRIAYHEYYVCQTYMPKVLDFFLVPYMKATDTGMQLAVYLKKG